MDLCMLPAHEQGRRLIDGELTATELLEAVLARIEQHNPTLNAVVSLDEKKARKNAERADTALRRGEVRGPLTGVPMTLKDGWDVAGMRTTVGTPMLDRTAAHDSTVAQRLRFAGANLIGHTNVAPFLADYVTDNEIFGRSSNPWDTDRTPGGSSGGAAAAVAAGLSAVEIASDLAGSVRLPAHMCGVYGLMATEHRIPATGFFSPPPRPLRALGTFGPMARDLEDLEIVLRMISGPDGFDSDVPVSPLGTRRRRKLSSLKVAVATSLPGTPTAATAVRSQVDRVAAGLTDNGSKVAERLPDFDWDASMELFGELLEAMMGAFDPSAELPDEQRSLAWYLEALSRRDAIAGAWHEFFRDSDVLIVPAALTTAPRHDAGDTLDIDGEAVPAYAQGAPLVFANLGGLTVLNAPAGTDDGMPIGIQLVGPAWSDLKLIDIAHELEQAGILPGFTPPAGF